MKKTLLPHCLSGTIRVPASKSQAHRLLICAALSQSPTTLHCDGLSDDIVATIRCLRGMGAVITVDGTEIAVSPISAISSDVCTLDCGESGSTLRFLLPVVGALGLQAVFQMAGRLPERPLEPLTTQLVKHGMALMQEGSLLHCSGSLKAGAYQIPGNISSQFISGLLFVLPLLDGNSTLTVTETLESGAYVAMTEQALTCAGIQISHTGSVYQIAGNQRYQLPEQLAVEGDWSNAAFWLCAGAITATPLTVAGLNLQSGQGDRQILSLLRQFGAQIIENENLIAVRGGALRGIHIDAAEIPDLIPILSVVAAAADGETVITNAARLRLKESDRLHTVFEMLSALGAELEELPDGLRIRGGNPLKGGRISACGDHRIAMSAAICSLLCQTAITIDGSESVNKSYPSFWEDFRQLAGKEESI
ncbi:MAG: 3-phosphoshikimate 1-carboxyvinyltransferase [Oscillospiraceae bacterium]|jgi:3-phosphoshikimate 1-carboxyvinyltransferase